MSFNPGNVEKALQIMKRFAAERGLGRPAKILTHIPGKAPWTVSGVGIEWESSVRNAIACPHDDVEEIKRRFREWMDEPVSLDNPSEIARK